MAVDTRQRASQKSGSVAIDGSSASTSDTVAVERSAVVGGNSRYLLKLAASHQICRRKKCHPYAVFLRSSLSSSASRSLGQEGAFVVHAFALLCYVRVWLWHLTPAAQLLPGSTGFGWFFRYLTFYSFSWQMLQLFIACLADISQVCLSLGVWRMFLCSCHC